MKKVNDHIIFEKIRFKIVPEIEDGKCTGCYFLSQMHCPREECEDELRSDNTNVIFLIDQFKYGR